MTEYSHNLYPQSDSGLIEKFEKMLKLRQAYFFDVEEVESLSDFYLEKNNLKKAKLAVNHGLSIFTDSSTLLLKKAQIFAASKESTKALEILEFLEAAEPTNTDMLLFKAVVHRNLSDHEGTKSCLLKALEIAPENREEIFMDLAYEQQIANDYKGAIDSLKESLKINPNHEASLFELSYCYEMADQIDLGVEFFQKYLNKFPYNFVGWYNLALCFDKIGLFEKGVESADFCIAIQEDFVAAYILKGNLLTSMDMDIAAAESYKDSLEHDSENPLVYTAIGECQERMELWNMAELNYKKALAIDPEYVEALMGLGAIREHEGDLAKAIAYYEEGVKKDDFHLDNRHILVETYIKADKLAEAKRHLEEMIKVFPDDAESWIALADLSAAEGFSIALEIIDEAIEKLPSEYDLKWQKIKHLLKCKKQQQALELFLICSTDNPEGLKYFLTIFPEAIQFSNIAGLIEIQDKAQKENEL
jgi:tetratricopeptide (TPR) repeat protein